MEKVTIKIEGETCLLHAHKALYWVNREILIIADAHIGKITHFINGGIPLPEKAANQNIERLYGLMEEFQPKQLILLGDLFHSIQNKEWASFERFVKDYPKVKMQLVMGNHEILEKEIYTGFGLMVYDAPKIVAPFVFSHEPLEVVPQSLYNLAGHIHPGVKLKGTAAQQLRLPCFYFGNRQAILPAFGAFTGKHVLKPKISDRIFVIAGQKIMNVSGSLEKNTLPVF